jgi:hypothetical protein
MSDSSGVTTHQASKDSESVKDKPVGLKLYVVVYTIGWMIALLLTVFGGPLFWLFIPIPIAGLYVVYRLWNLAYWAWAVTIALHILSFFLSIGRFLLGDLGVLSFGGGTALTIIVVGYLYARRSYFRDA